MKKSKITAHLTITILIFIMASIVLFSLIAGGKTAITSVQFENMMDAKGFTVIEATDQFNNESVECVKTAVSCDSNYQIDYYLFSTVKAAEEAYSNYEDLLTTNYPGTGSASATHGLASNSKIAVTTDEKYAYISRIENTFVYVVADYKYKEEIKGTLNELGY